jgi:hypothetical protein
MLDKVLLVICFIVAPIYIGVHIIVYLFRG